MMHEAVHGRRFDRYHELGQYAFGEKLGLYIVVPQQLIVEVSVEIIYMVTGGKSLQKFHHSVCDGNCKDIKLTYFIMIFASIQLILSHLPSYNSISCVSLVAAITCLSYSTIAWSASVHKGVQPDVEYGYNTKSTAGTVFNFFSALGDVAFAYAGHNVVLGDVVALCYFPVALIGYWMFGNAIFAMPVFDMFETMLVKKLQFRPTATLRFITRTLYVGSTMFIAICFPFFGSLLGFIGGFTFTPTTYFLPCVMWLCIYKPKRYSLSWFTNWICIFMGVCLMVLSPIRGLREIVLETKTYEFFS